MIRISFDELTGTLCRILERSGFENERAKACARLFAETTLDGVHSHGVNRFPRFLEMIQNGTIDIHGRPELVRKFAAIEQWDGRSGPGNLNASACMARAIHLSQEFGIGCVALANTNHWMRGGTYGWQAAEAGAIGICWTNTMPNLPAWGTAIPNLGNNPLVVAVPRPGGHIVLDMAMSQFSFGALASYRERGLLLPVDGGFDITGSLTRDPAAIETSQRPLPIGYWKGSGLAIVLDMMAAMISGGLATHQILQDPLRETSLSQVFICLSPSKIQSEDASTRISDEIIGFILQSPSSGEPIRYPGQKVVETRTENLAHGIPVRKSLWNELSSLLQGAV
jgi:3-dehydro-L-gulonate 2-dehydrogenase